MLISLKVPENIAKLFSPVAKFVFGTSGYGAYVFIMSIFAGYPAGARIVGQLIEDKKISLEEGQQILTFSSTSGPLFIIGAVGSGMLNSPIAGYILYITHILGAVLNGIVLRIFFKKKSIKQGYTFYDSKKTSSSGDILSKGIMTSLVTSGFIGGYIILFSVIITLLNKIQFFSVLNDLLQTALFLPQPIANYICTLLETSIEISNGSKIISQLPLSFDLKLIFASFIIAFSGFSIIGQVSSVLSKTKISMGKYIVHKFIHGIFSSLLCYVFLKVNFFDLPAYSTANIFIIPDILSNLLTLLILILMFNTLAYLKGTGHRKTSK
jgi:sporulation integral membrane protein YlbJ